jgi:magnesium transporter
LTRETREPDPSAESGASTAPAGGSAGPGAQAPASLDPEQQSRVEERITRLVEDGDVEALDAEIAALHPADLAALFESIDPRHWPRAVAGLSTARISDLMEELPDHLRDDLAALLRPVQIGEALGEMASDDAADVLADLPENLARKIIDSLPDEDRTDLEALLRYPEDSAGGLMQTELVSVLESQSVDSAVQAIRAQAEEVGDFHFVHVVDDDGRLVGVLNLRELILAAPDRPVADLMLWGPMAVTPDVDQEDVARIFSRYDLVVLPVVDDDGHLLGRILHDDVMDVLEEEADEDMFQMAGASAQEHELVYTASPLKVATLRLPWLLATLAGLTVPALLVWQFQISFPTMLVLVPFIPVIGAMGGNIGAQSSTIVVRGFATGRVDYNNLWKFLSRELVVSLLMGLACGAVSGLVAVVWHGDLRLAAVVTLSMVAAIVASALMGVIVPYVFKLVRVDPAIAAGPLVTTIDDIIAIGIYYLVALALIAR